MSFFKKPQPPKHDESQQEKILVEVDSDGVHWIKCPGEGIRISLQHMQLGQVVIDGTNFVKLIDESSDIQPAQA